MNAKIAAIAVVAALTGCQGADPTSPDQDLSLHRGRGDRDWSSRCVTTFVFTGPASLHITGMCRFEDLGSAALSADQTLAANPDGTQTIENVSTYQFRHGTLTTKFVGQGQFTSASHIGFSGTETVQGGTGRFSRARGAGHLEGSADVTGPTGGEGLYRTTGRLDRVRGQR